MTPKTSSLTPLFRDGPWKQEPKAPSFSEREFQVCLTARLVAPRRVVGDETERVHPLSVPHPVPGPSIAGGSAARRPARWAPQAPDGRAVGTA